ncbi:LexA family protein [Peptostreptococcus anaerobius]|uniref:LexA family protein n=1 Tax=Peptostreptococcus anaerobius TaxID=1261 RepID=UPI001896DDC1|nr:LexA family transcriptional regulator [Peptostreptococcus anaerobius]MDB8852518.1 LexA family transcriptional regulator [Peptostreptococcus anaerobius]
MNNKEIFSKNLYKQLELHDITRAELARKLGYPETTVSNWANAVSYPRIDKIQEMADFFGIMKSDLTENKSTEERPLPSNLIPITKVNRIPVVGTIAAGKPITATENIDSYIVLNDEYKADFALRIKGDSMIDAGINDGDLALIIKDRPIDNGDIYAVLIDGDATLKKVYKNDDYLTLQPCNSKYQPIMVKEEDEPYIVGKLSGIVRKY